MGFSATHYQVDQLEMSCFKQKQQFIPMKTFRQYVFDNADFNISALDGLNTFHSLGGIKCVAPAKVLPKLDEIKRLKSSPPIVEVGKLGVLELQSCEKIQKKV